MTLNQPTVFDTQLTTAQFKTSGIKKVEKRAEIRNLKGNWKGFRERPSQGDFRFYFNLIFSSREARVPCNFNARISVHRGSFGHSHVPWTSSFTFWTHWDHGVFQGLPPGVHIFCVIDDLSKLLQVSGIKQFWLYLPAYYLGYNTSNWPAGWHETKDALIFVKGRRQLFKRLARYDRGYHLFSPAHYTGEGNLKESPYSGLWESSWVIFLLTPGSGYWTPTIRD